MNEPAKDLLGGITREQAMVDAGVCVGLSFTTRPEVVLDADERAALKRAGTTLYTLLSTIWNDPALCLLMRDRLEQIKANEKGKG